MITPRGFSYAGINCGIKAARNDLALVHSEVACVAAGCFTINASRAAPVRDAETRLPATNVRAIVVNSGNANALVGPGGERDVREVCAAVATALGVEAESVLAASTGAVGAKLPVHKLVGAATRLAAARGTAMEPAAEAILTTDTRPKLAARSLRIGAVEVSIAGFAKGSGTVGSELATVLAFLTTDAAVTPSALRSALARAARCSFEMIDTDRETSTNDAVFALANGLARNQPITEGTSEYEALAAALEAVSIDLARAIAEDGDGAANRLEVQIHGAPDVEMARELARTVAGSSSVQAAIFKGERSWDRVLSALGARVGSRRWPIDPTRATVRMQRTCVYEAHGPVSVDEGALRARLRERLVEIDVQLAEGGARATAWARNRVYEHAAINSHDPSITSASSDGIVAGDDRLTNHTPGFKRALLVEALSYIARFTNTRAVIKYGGAAMVKDSLKASFANDINLLRSAGLLPVVVHGGGPEITQTLEKLGMGKSEFVDGVRVTGREDVKVVEMVLTGKINTELVSLLNQSSAHAVGLSGKDAGLLRARKLVGERDLGMVGEITHVNHELLEILLDRKYVPVVSPVGLGEDGEGYNINADAAAAEIAIALRAEKLIYLTDVAGVMENGQLLSEISAGELERKIADGVVRGGMVAKAKSVLRAIEGGVTSVYILDGRTPHSVIAELFTDRGVGTLVRRG
ncbi:MAG: acetylglutamate kinase [Myxococcota bacterium]|nr:acetylglutamate kinase [Myxococcota bacterium]